MGTILECLAAFNARRVIEEARGVVRRQRPEFQAPAREPRQTAISEASGLEASTGAALRGIVLAGAIPRVPLSEADLAARFAGKGPWFTV